MISEVRPETTEIFPYAEKITSEINSLLKQEIPTQNITVIGGSKGAIIGAAVSAVLQNPHVNFVLIAGNSDGIEQGYSFNLYGNILTFYDTSPIHLLVKAINRLLSNLKRLLILKKYFCKPI